MRVGLAVVSGLLLALAFPKTGVGGFAWVAPGAMLAVAIGVNGRQAFRLGYVAGLAHYLTSLSWLLRIPVNKLAPISGWLALSGFLALYPAVWVGLCWRIYPERLDQTTEGVGAVFERFLSAGWARRLGWTLSCAALWVSWEMTQARLLTGFPWNFLGASQYRMLPLIQIASFTGVYGLSFLAAWFAASVLCAAVIVLRRSQHARQWMGEIILPLLVTAGVVACGLRQVFAPAIPGPTLKVALVQPSIPQQWIWAPEESSKRFEQILRLSEVALTNNPDLLVWPEAAVPGLVRWDTNIHQAVTNLVRRHQTWLVMGSDDVVPRGNARRPSDYDTFNSSFLISPEGEFKATYRKRRLVIFGEYLPFHRLLPFLERWTGMGSFSPGTGPVPFCVPALDFKAAVLICFEDVFAHGVRGYVDDDTDFLLNLTNNGWFGESAAQWQHAANAVFRAVENRVPLVRCANNGLTCWVDPQGRLQEVYFPETRDIYRAGVKQVEVPLLAGRKREPTFYRRYGDVFGWSCVAWSLLAVGVKSLKSKV